MNRQNKTGQTASQGKAIPPVRQTLPGGVRKALIADLNIKHRLHRFKEYNAQVQPKQADRELPPATAKVKGLEAELAACKERAASLHSRLRDVACLLRIGQQHCYIPPDNCECTPPGVGSLEEANWIAAEYKERANTLEELVGEVSALLRAARSLCLIAPLDAEPAPL